jgi:DNA-binding CsgD family transcriptional regulator/ArsR family metal-binding transcriptional regulator
MNDMFISKYKNITVQQTGMLTFPRPKLGACLEVAVDLSVLFPYINSSIEGAQYFGQPERVQFFFKDVQCSVYAKEIVAAAFRNHEHVQSFAGQLQELLNSLYSQRTTIEPDYRTVKHLSVPDVYAILPKTNCGACRLPSCLAFAASLSRGKTDTGQCPHLGSPIAQKVVYPVLDDQGQMARTIELDLPGKNSVPTQQAVSLLTDREREVLQLLTRGWTNPEIGEQLCISPHTVKSHVVHICAKLKVRDRTQAAVRAVQQGLV